MMRKYLNNPVAVFEAFAAEVEGGLDVEEELIVDGFDVEAGLAFEQLQERGRDAFFEFGIQVDGHEVEADEIFLQDEAGHGHFGGLVAVGALDDDGLRNHEVVVALAVHGGDGGFEGRGVFFEQGLQGDEDVVEGRGVGRRRGFGG